MNITTLPDWKPKSRFDRLAIVTDDDGAEVKVRWIATSGDSEMWRCQVHGPMRVARCPHSLIVAAAFASQMFGIETEIENNTTRKEPTK